MLFMIGCGPQWICTIRTLRTNISTLHFEPPLETGFTQVSRSFSVPYDPVSRSGVRAWSLLGMGTLAEWSTLAFPECSRRGPVRGSFQMFDRMSPWDTCTGSGLTVR
jgi:hypothetical protein